jgi:hypothetical protein
MTACVLSSLNFAGVRVGHDDQPAPIVIDTVANGLENFTIRPPAERPSGRGIRGYERSNRYGQVFREACEVRRVLSAAKYATISNAIFELQL